ncbi:T9SS type A sorting domain-containing protein [Neolewinella persica]|uniref:T9SS type A sorting domain-containing protein n=1 Tax=Neolewinella persica TaxID=70998 RepID=UPI00036D8CFC|nr:T9SS type A sorting domain-containing protein [Neolewinella persica]
MAYYRILARDFDGEEDYSLVRRVTWRADDERAVRVFPNPVGGSALTVNWVSPEAERVNWHVYNTYGQEVRKGHVGAAAGANTVELAVDELPAGVYLLRLRSKDWDWTGSLVRR